MGGFGEAFQTPDVWSEELGLPDIGPIWKDYPITKVEFLARQVKYGEKMCEPDLSTLPQRMRYAAEVLDEAQDHFQLSNGFEWSAGLLRADATHIEVDERRTAEAAERKIRIEELACTLYDAQRTRNPDPQLFNHCSGSGLSLKENCRALAANVINAGWRKD